MLRRVAIVVFDGCQSLDVAGPLEVFHGATARLRGAGAEDEGYAVTVVAATTATVRSESGLRIAPDVDFAGLARAGGRFDTIVVSGGSGVANAAADAAFVAAVLRLSTSSERTASVCTGAFVLAAAGLLDGRRATTHWAFCDRLAELFPRVRVEPDHVYVRDGSVWSSAGVTAGMDLALALVARDYGPALATTVARWLVVFVRRAGAQAQVSEQQRLAEGEQGSVRDLVTWVAAHPGRDLTVPVLARRAGMSVRNFARLFRAETGFTPARYVAQVRLEAARRLLETSGMSMDEIAAACGLGTASALRRLFGRRVGATPRQYRERVTR